MIFPNLIFPFRESISRHVNNIPLIQMFVSYFLAGMGMPEQAVATLHAAKMAQLNALGQNFDKLPLNLLPPHLDLSKITNPDIARIQAVSNAAMEQANNKGLYHNDRNADIRRDDPQPMDLGLDNNQSVHSESRGRGNGDSGVATSHAGNSSGEDEYGSDEDIDNEQNL